MRDTHKQLREILPKATLVWSDVLPRQWWGNEWIRRRMKTVARTAFGYWAIHHWGVDEIFLVGTSGMVCTLPVLERAALLTILHFTCTCATIVHLICRVPLWGIFKLNSVKNTEQIQFNIVAISSPQLNTVY